MDLAARIVVEIRTRRTKEAVSKVTLYRWSKATSLLYGPSGYLCDHCLQPLELGENVVATRESEIKAIMHPKCFNAYRERSH